MFQQAGTGGGPVGIALRRGQRAHDGVQNLAPLLFQAIHDQLIGPGRRFKSFAGLTDRIFRSIP